MSTAQENVVTRFAPSPTGFLHVGGVRTALFSYLYARQNKGKFILRIEDTDKVRSTKEFEKDIMDGLAWLGLEHDELFRQSDRTEIYKAALEKLISEGKAYVSQEKVEKEGDRAEVIRFKNPNKKVAFDDMIRGHIEFNTTELKDFVIAKSLTEPIFHFVVVFDDAEMGVTHVIRGEDHISNTPRQILIQEALGASRPIYAHLPLILAEDRSKLSKRKHGEKVSLKHYIEKGYLKETIINFMALLGWNPGDEREVLTLDDLIKEFKIENVQKGGAVFNVEKLQWLNREYIKKLPQEELLKIVSEKLPQIPSDTLIRALPIVIDRISTFQDIADFSAQGEFDYLFKKPEYAKEKLLWKGTTDAETTKKHLNFTLETLAKLEKFPAADATKAAIWDYATEAGRGEVLWPLRYALSGKEKSPDPFTLISILGTEESSARIQDAIAKL